MSGSSVSQAHDGILAELVDRIGIYALVEIVRRRGVVAEGDPPLGIGISLRQQFVKIVVRIVDHHGRSSGKIAMRPGVRENMHRDAGGLQAFVFCQLNSGDKKIAVGTADQPEFVLVEPGSSGNFRGQVAGQEMKGCPDPCYVLQTEDIRSRVHDLQMQLRRSGGERRIDPREQRDRAAVRELGAAADLHTLLVRIAGKISGAVCGVIMKVDLHRHLRAKNAALSFLNL